MNNDMKIDPDSVLNAIYKAIDSLNESLPKDRRVEKSPHASLIDDSGTVDSLGLTLLIVSLEQKLEEELGVTVTLVSDNVYAKEGNPFQNVNSLTKYILKLVDGSNG